MFVGKRIRLCAHAVGMFIAVATAGCASEETTRDELLARAAQQTEANADAYTYLECSGRTCESGEEPTAFRFQTYEPWWKNALDVLMRVDQYNGELPVLKVSAARLEEISGGRWFWVAAQVQRGSQSEELIGWVPFAYSELETAQVPFIDDEMIDARGGTVDAARFCAAFLNPEEHDTVTLTRAWFWLDTDGQDAPGDWLETFVVPNRGIPVRCITETWNGAPMALRQAE